MTATDTRRSPAAPEELWTPKQTASYLNTTEGTLSTERYLGRGLPYVKIGRRVRYRASDVRAYIDAHVETPGETR